MKRLLLFLVLFGITTTVLAQTNGAGVLLVPITTNPSPTASQTVHANFNLSSAWLTAVIPLVIAFAKKLVPKLPPSWLPIIAPILGAAGDALSSYLTHTTPNPALGALFGSAGVGVREVLNQIKTPTPVVLSPKTAAPPAAIKTP